MWLKTITVFLFHPKTWIKLSGFTIDLLISVYISFFTAGNLVFLQSIGIPMGIDQAPFWTNLYLYHFESELLSHRNRYRGFKFQHCF